MLSKTPTRQNIKMMKGSSLHYAREAPVDLGYAVRKGDDTNGIEALAASIAQHGCIVPLIVKSHGGKFYVISGNRRLKALRLVHGSAEFDVQTVEADEFGADPREIALATNVALPMHPIDRFEVIQMLVGEGMTEDDAKRQFALSDRAFSQVMKLGKLSDLVKQSYREGKIDGKTAQAFTLLDDHKRQNKIYNEALKASYTNPPRVSEHAVRSRILPANAREVSKLVGFVGVDVVRGENLLANEDMFGGDHTVTDVKKLKALADRKMDEVRAIVLRHGWSWVDDVDSLGTARWSYGRVQAEKEVKVPPSTAKTVESLAKIIDGEVDGDVAKARSELAIIDVDVNSAIFSDKQKAKAGCFIKIHDDGSVEIEYGRTKPEDRKSAQASDARSKQKPKKDGEQGITQALAGRLSKHVQDAGAEMLKTNHRVAVSAMIAAFASGGQVLDVSIGTASPAKGKVFVDVFAGAMAATDEQRSAMLAQIAAEALSVTTFVADKMPFGNEAVVALFAAFPRSIGALMVKHFDAKAYFESVPLSTCVQAVREAMSDSDADKVAKMKKSDAAKFCVHNVAPKGWLPSQMRHPHYDGPSAKPDVLKPGAKASGAKNNKKTGVDKPAKKKKTASKAASKKATRTK